MTDLRSLEIYLANYRVVLRLKNKERIVCGFEDFLSAKVFKQACLDLLYSTKIVDINLVYSNGMKTPKDKPKGEHPFGLLWCPYCRSYRRFIDWSNYFRCEVCNISVADFYVKRFNGFYEVPKKQSDLNLASRFAKSISPKDESKKQRRRERRLRRKRRINK